MFGRNAHAGGSVRIALDVMSGDRGPAVAIAGALRVLKREPMLQLLLVGDRTLINTLIGDHPQRDRIHVHHASEVVAMHEPPAAAMRGKKDSSMRVALNLLKAGDADACVSAGNTGALMATARYVLKTLPGIDRPAIVSMIPAIGGHTHMLDLGANAGDCTPEQLVQFAIMGTVMAMDLNDIERPRVGLLNIGEEAIKGGELLRRASQMLSASELNYIGFVEGDDIFSGKVDVVVTDGFTGNVSLKTMEGAAHMLSAYLRTEFSRTLATRILGLFARPVLRSVRRRLDPRRYNGATMVGLQGIVIKSHGDADEVAFANALRIAMLEVDKAVPAQITHLLEEHFAREQAV